MVGLHSCGYCAVVVCRSYYLAVELGLLVVVIVQWWKAFFLRSLCCGVRPSRCGYCAVQWYVGLII